MKTLLNLLLILLIFIFSFSCGNHEQPEEVEKQTVEETEIVQEIKSPANTGSSVSNLHLGDNGQLYLTWVESSEDENFILFYSKLKENAWQSPNKIAEGDNWVVNWADFPSLTQFGENLAANVLVETNSETYAYDVQLLISNNNGTNWNSPFIPHNDGTQTEHGFVSLVPYEGETFMAIWLDGRKYATGEDEMTLRAAIINKAGKTEQEFVLDERVCDCCATDAIRTKEGIAVVYRNRDENEVRDMSIVYFQNGNWTEPELIAQDNWEIAGCPVNGPAIDASNNKTAIAWFTQAKEIPTVKFIFSDGFTQSFSAPITINENSPIGRVDVCVIDENTAAVSWMDGDEKATYLKVRTVKTDGTSEIGEPIVVAEMDGGRSSGFPKMIKKEDKLLFTWTDVKEKNIKTAEINVSNLN
jgi:hypothetical protein